MTKKKRQITSAFAMRLTTITLGVLVMGYLAVAGTLLGRKTNQLNQKIAAQKASHLQQDSINFSGDALCIEKNCFHIEIAQTAAERQKGLMDRNFLPSQSGMLFVFEEEKPYGFWMKNTLIPLDMIWLDSNKKVVDIAHGAQPCGEENSAINKCPSYTPSTPALYVLEINA